MVFRRSVSLQERIIVCQVAHTLMFFVLIERLVALTIEFDDNFRLVVCRLWLFGEDFSVTSLDVDPGLQTANFSHLEGFLASNRVVGIKLIERVWEELIAAIHQVSSECNVSRVTVPVVLQTLISVFLNVLLLMRVLVCLLQQLLYSLFILAQIHSERLLD